MRYAIIALFCASVAFAGSEQNQHEYDPNVGAIPIQHKMTPPPAKAPVVNVNVEQPEEDSYTVLISSIVGAVVAIAGVLTAYLNHRKKKAGA
jgi:uncharacterized protein YcfJ